jgi:hypothetical protein
LKTGISPEPARHAPRKEIQNVGSAVQNQLLSEQAEGYVKALEKSVYPRSTMKEVFEHSARDD